MSGEPTQPKLKESDVGGSRPQEAANNLSEDAQPATSHELASEHEYEPETTAAAESQKELLASANAASGPARNAWLAFFGLLAYLMVTLAGVTHVDLLLNSPVTLPLINVDIPLFSFFGVAPYLLLLVHLSLLIQHALLAHKYQYFSEAIAADEDSVRRDHPMRRLVHNYVFAQMLAGPRPPWPLRMLMRLMVFVTFSLLPVVVLLYFQIKFLPSHDVATIHAIRIAILLDLTLLFVVCPFVAMPYLRPCGRKLRFGKSDWRWELSYASLTLGVSLFVATTAFSLLVATVPQACFWPFGERTEKTEEECFSLDRMTARWWPRLVRPGEGADLLVLQEGREVFAPTKWLFEGKFDQTGGRLRSLFTRNLVITDKDLVAQTDFQEGETTLLLRGRDLRFAVFDRSDLRRADLFGSDLRGASAAGATLDHAVFDSAQLRGTVLVFARMQGAKLFGAQMQGAFLAEAQMQGAFLGAAQMQGADLQYARMQRAMLREAQLQGADLSSAQLQGADLREAQMQNADLTGAQVQGANLSEAQMLGTVLGGTDMREANLSSARMQGAILREALMQGAILSNAQMQKANLHNARMQGADLDLAQMQGAFLDDALMLGAGLAGAQMQGASLRRAQMQAVDLREAQMQGVDLTGAQMQGADLRSARLQGADLNSAQLKGADLDGTLIWLTSLPKTVEGAILKVDLSPPNPAEITAVLAGLPGDSLQDFVASRLDGLREEKEIQKWGDSADHARWQNISGRRPDASSFAQGLSALACQDSLDGWLIRAVAQRLLESVRRPSYAKETASKLINKETCPAAGHLDKQTLTKLADLAATETEPEHGQ
jgi:uncharacterized protein YjbI with pentapeptide repeats